MRRGLGLLFLILSLLWQSAALAGGQVLPGFAEDAQHAALHWQERGHHHHDDGSYEEHEDLDTFHVHFDAASGSVALPASMSLTLAASELAPPSFRYLVTLPSPPPSGWRRPPRPIA